MSSTNLLRSLKPLPPSNADGREVVNLTQAQLKWPLAAAVEKNIKIRAPKLNESERAKRASIWQVPVNQVKLESEKFRLQRGPNRIDLANGLRHLADQLDRPLSVNAFSNGRKGQSEPEAKVFKSRKRENQTPLQALFARLDHENN